MGSLSLPTSGEVYLDANAIIYAVEGIAPYDSLLDPIWPAAQAGQFTVVTSELALIETLVKPFLIADVALETSYRTLLQKTREVQMMPITVDILEAGARLRATARIKTPDAIHAATALATQCALFITNDSGFRQVPGLPLAILSDLLGP